MAKKKKAPDKLAQDAAAALAAGMTYGKWKAMNSHPVTIEKKIPDGWRVCEWCGKPFRPSTKSNKRFCEVYCQKEAYHARRRQQRTVQ